MTEAVNSDTGDNSRRMNLYVISCRVFLRPIMACSAKSKHTVDIDFMGQSLHENPDRLCRVLQDKINKPNERFYDAVVLGYGLCGNGITGLRAGEIPLVVPRVHDCVSVFLGGHDRYMEEFNREPGTFWYIPEYLEQQTSGADYKWKFGRPLEYPSPEDPGNSPLNYSEDNKRYLHETMGSWKQHYKRAVLLETGAHIKEELLDEVEAESQRNNWDFVKMPGSMRLFEKLINGPWDEEFLVLRPGEEVPAKLIQES